MRTRSACDRMRVKCMPLSVSPSFLLCVCARARASVPPLCSLNILHTNLQNIQRKSSINLAPANGKCARSMQQHKYHTDRQKTSTPAKQPKQLKHNTKTNWIKQMIERQNINTISVSADPKKVLNTKHQNGERERKRKIDNNQKQYNRNVLTSDRNNRFSPVLMIYLMAPEDMFNCASYETEAGYCIRMYNTKTLWCVCVFFGVLRATYDKEFRSYEWKLKVIMRLDKRV